ncbi:MAG: autotransporter assembly complex family protein [Halopseudomonas sp.]
MPSNPNSISVRYLLSLLLTTLTPTTHASELLVKISGINKELTANVESYLSIYALHEQPTPNPGRLRYLHRKAGQEIRKALEPFGYYRPQIDATLEQVDNQWQAHYRIDPADPIRIHNSEIALAGDGKDDPALQQLIPTQGFNPGDRLDHRRYERLKATLQSFAAENGYYDGRWQQQQILIDLENYQADIELIYNSGARYHFGALIINQTAISTELLERYPEFETGAVFKTRELLDLQASLSNSGYFSRVEVRPLWNQADDLQVPIQVQLEPNKQTQYQLGAGYGTDTGARGTVGFNRRWLNSQGHRFHSQLQLANEYSEFTNEYVIPGFQPQTDLYKLQLDLKKEDSSTVDSETILLGGSRQQQLQHWSQTTGLSWEHERFVFDAEPTQTRNLIPYIRWSRIATDNPLDVDQGYRASLTLQGAAEKLFSDTQFLQALLSIKGVYSLSDNFRLLARGDLGATAIDDFNQLPATHRFYAGGDQSVRGYDYKSLGPQDSEGNVIGGTGLIVISTEIDYRIKPDWRLALFVDKGDAANSFEEGLNTGVGAGLRWQSPFGPIRLDVAKALNLDGTPWRIHFTLGPDL